MTLAETMQALQAAGTEQTRKTYLRHGCPEPVFGVSFAEFGKLKKKTGVDHALAQQLWATGNGDAQVLATMLADPERATAAELDTWGRALRWSLIAQMVSRYAASTKFAQAKAEQWTKSSREHTAEAGYYVVAHLAKDAALPDAWFEEHLDRIEKSIHKAKNMARYAMNAALIGIGVRNPKLTELALAAAARIGKVTVDHGDTACQTPDAAAYIQKTLAHPRRASSATSRKRTSRASES